MSAHLHDYLILVLRQQLKVSLVWVSVPHRMVIPGTTIDVLDYDELAPFVCIFELLGQPEHLLHSIHRWILLLTVTVVIKRIDG